tara:strand:- start:1312 stop:2439 length:1128 start_codon:yes stop_codon:yes gene_type:complete
MSRIAVLIVAAGKSSRFGGEIPKPYVLLQGKPVVQHSIDAFRAVLPEARLLVVVHPSHGEFVQKLDVDTVAGGEERHHSVERGLEALAEDAPDQVLIHDAARPYVTAALITRIVAALEESPAVIPATAVTDTIKQVQDSIVTQTLPRAQLRAVQTPQGFDYAALCAAYEQLDGSGITDDAMVMEQAGHWVAVIEGDEANRKLTTAHDRRDIHMKETRIGQGVDVHQLYEDAARPLMICGVEVPSKLALRGHSDADVGLHALVDAMLGALGKGDIGQHFPPSDPQWKNADSADFVAEAVRLMQSAGGALINADLTIIGESPKIGPHRAAMQQRVAALLDVAPERINIKATTTEELGFTGRKEGLAAQAVVSIALGG